MSCWSAQLVCISLVCDLLFPGFIWWNDTDFLMSQVLLAFVGRSFFTEIFWLCLTNWPILKIWKRACVRENVACSDFGHKTDKNKNDVILPDSMRIPYNYPITQTPYDWNESLYYLLHLKYAYMSAIYDADLKSHVNLCFFLIWDNAHIMLWWSWGWAVRYNSNKYQQWKQKDDIERKTRKQVQHDGRNMTQQ